MLGTKSRCVFVDLVGESVFAARTSGTKAPFVVEELREIPSADPAGTAEAIRSLSGASRTGFSTACCAVYPSRRVVSRISADPRKVREDGYIAETVREALKIDPASYSLFLLSPEHGSDLLTAANPSRDVLVCGAPSEELAAAQEHLLELGLFPLRMEIGTVSAAGGIVDYLGFAASRAPTLLLEVGSENTNVFIVTRDGVEITRSVAFGVNSMIPVVQKELTLKDEESARKLFFSNNFDFTGMGPQLTKRLLRELQASIGFYEVQTGQSVSQMCCTLVPSKIAWLERTLSEMLGMKVLKLDHAGWLRSMGIEFASSVAPTELGAAWTSLFCLMGQYKGRHDEAAA